MNRQVFGGGKCQNCSSSNVTQNREFLDWLDRLKRFVWNFATFARLPFGHFFAGNS